MERLNEDITDFCSSTSIHGMSNVTDPKQGFLLKAIWTCVVVASFVCAGICIKESIDEWNTNPILISVETTDYPIENINFPSITVCREDNEQNCFEFVSKIMDHIQFPCFDEGKPKTCHRSREVFSNFNKLFDNITKEMSDRLTDNFNAKTTLEDAKKMYNESNKIEKAFLDLFLVLGKNNVSEEIIDEIISELHTNAGPVLERLTSYPTHSILKPLTLKFKKYLSDRRLESHLGKNPANDTKDNERCQSYLLKGVKFLSKMEILFPRLSVSSEDYLEKRPDFYLGRFFSMFADKVFEHDFGINFTTTENLSVIEKDVIHFVNKYFNRFIAEGLNLDDPKTPACIFTAEELINENFERFIRLIKYSQIGNTFQGPEDKVEFEEKYINGSMFFNGIKTQDPKYLNLVGIIPFCEKESSKTLTKVSSLECNLFDTIVTAKGLCYTFNSKTMSEIFRKSNTIQSWNSVFNLKKKSQIVNPKGYGPFNGLQFATNAFMPSSDYQTSRNMIISITNANNPFDVFKENYVIEPGHIYTYRIVANQIATTQRFNDLDPKVRDCLLPHENKKVNMSTLYSKSSCEYECTIKFAKQKCKCIPWNIPRLPNDNTRFCFYEDDDCFTNAMEVFQQSSCDCPSDCSETAFSVFESKSLIESPGHFCDTLPKRKYMNMVLCDICFNILRHHRIRFIYDYVINDGPDPRDRKTLCDKIIKENVAIVKVEMPTKSLTRSIKDKRFNFVGQLASLGGTLGLFVGMSLMSGMEILIWIFRIVFKYFFPTKIYLNPNRANQNETGL